MKITKFGHCCLLIEESGLKFLTDPGWCSTLQNEVTGLHAVLVTHDHADHLHVDSLKAVLKKNPSARIITNTGTAPAIQQAGFAPVILDDGQNLMEGSVLLEAYGKEHAAMYPTLPATPNTGFFIANRLFYPGDAFLYPPKDVEILALPVSGPWLTIGQAIDYALLLKPKFAFPVHDGIRFGSAHIFTERILNPSGISFVTMSEGDSKEF